jgi:hypothetical protein
VSGEILIRFDDIHLLHNDPQYTGKINKMRLFRGYYTKLVAECKSKFPLVTKNIPTHPS